MAGWKGDGHLPTPFGTGGNGLYCSFYGCFFPGQGDGDRLAWGEILGLLLGKGGFEKIAVLLGGKEKGSFPGGILPGSHIYFCYRACFLCGNDSPVFLVGLQAFYFLLLFLNIQGGNLGGKIFTVLEAGVLQGAAGLLQGLFPIGFGVLQSPAGGAVGVLVGGILRLPLPFHKLAGAKVLIIVPTVGGAL